MPDERRQFRILYRDFLFRMVDLELLSASGEIQTLLVQFVAMLAAFNFVVSIFSSKNEPGDGSEAIRRRVSFLIRVFGRPTGGDGCRKHRWFSFS